MKFSHPYGTGGTQTPTPLVVTASTELVHLLARRCTTSPNQLVRMNTFERVQLSVFVFIFPKYIRLPCELRSTLQRDRNMRSVAYNHEGEPCVQNSHPFAMCSRMTRSLNLRFQLMGKSASGEGRPPLIQMSSLSAMLEGRPAARAAIDFSLRKA